MKVNKKLLEIELNKTKKLMEDISIVNSGDLDNNWSANYHTRKQQGLEPFNKDGYTIIPHAQAKGWTKSLVKSIYMTQEQADVLNVLGAQIRELIQQYNEKYNEYAKE